MIRLDVVFDVRNMVSLAQPVLLQLYALLIVVYCSRIHIGSVGEYLLTL